jgi:hypothetical protein
MDTSDNVLMFGDVLLGMWSARDRLQKAGLTADRSDPIGGLAQSLTAAALWPSKSVAAAYNPARAMRAHARARRGRPLVEAMPTDCLDLHLARAQAAALTVLPSYRSFVGSPIQRVGPSCRIGFCAPGW